jgi:hypothetical protein
VSESRANLKLSPDQIHNYAVEKSAYGKQFRLTFHQPANGEDPHRY